MKWEEKKLGEICKIGDGAHAKIKRREKGKLYLTTKNFKINGLDLTKVDYISDEDFAKYFNSDTKTVKKPKTDDVLLNIIGSIGAPYLVKNSDEFGLSSSVSILRPNKVAIDPTYLYYWIKGPVFQKSIYQIKSGVAQSFLSLSMIRSLPIFFPKDIPTQKKIAAILSTYDELIENNRRRIQLLEEAAQQLYREWFVQLRFPGHEQVSMNEETGLPVGWEKLPFSECADFINGYAFKPKDHFQNGLPIIKIKELKNGITDQTPRSHGDQVKDKYHFGDGEILFSWSASLGVYWWTNGKALLNQHLFRVIPNDNINKVHFFYGLKGAISEFQNRTTGATMKHIKRSELDKVFYVKPPEEQTQAFNSIAEPILDQILILNKQIDRLQEARDILLPRLMNQTIEV